MLLTAAIVAACLAGAPKEEAQSVLPTVTIPGRMNRSGKKQMAKH